MSLLAGKFEGSERIQVVLRLLFELTTAAREDLSAQQLKGLMEVSHTLLGTVSGVASEAWRWRGLESVLEDLCRIYSVEQQVRGVLDAAEGRKELWPALRTSVVPGSSTLDAPD